jgi:hypothetical protein
MAKTTGSAGRGMATVPTAVAGLARGEVNALNNALRLGARAGEALENQDWRAAGEVAGDIEEFNGALPAGAIVDGAMKATLGMIAGRLRLVNEDQTWGADDQRSVRRSIIRLRNRIRPVLGLEPGR